MNYQQKVKHPPFDTQMLCAEIDPDLFFPDAHGKEQAKVAKKICNTCPSQHQCLRYGLHYKVTGVWGGKSTQERVALRKKLGIKGIPIAYDEWEMAVEK
jgi:WhiB family redox-sensing transcriptional regulator